MSGVHVQLELDGVAGCPASTLSEAGPVESVTVDRHGTGESAHVVGEVTVDRSGADGPDPAGVEEVFDDGSRAVYRYTHETACPCTRVPAHGCPIRDRRADSGRLVLQFIVPDLATLRTVVADLESYCTTLRVRRLVRSGVTDDDPSLLVADRSAFTDRQYEVLETAHEMGYFESPKGADSGAVADELGVSVSTFVEHLSVAQTKLFDQIMAT
ncbi:helix-turn-helix domain-containing protein [Haloplanus litoreus]|uniref:Helix-turn-helix domain-containing protein n=1 Tax=Haloplanus litoreus TaxID=767515 RepID=A0ABD6A2A6_9EURY